MDAKQKWNLTVFLTTVLVCFGLMVWLVVDEPSEAEITVINYAKEQGISVSAYPDNVIRLLENNPETLEFVLNYPFREEVEIDLSSYDLSLGVPLLMQWDPRWGYMEYGSDMVAVTGCGPMCLAMAGYYVTGDEKFYPDRVVAFALENGYDSPGSGSKPALISEGVKALGLKATQLSTVEKKIAAYLRAGDPIIALMGPGDFTSSSHYIVVTGYEDGMLSVNDPDSYVNSGKSWDFKTFADQAEKLWVIQAVAEG